MTNPLEQFRETVEQAYRHACELPELRERGIDKLLLRILTDEGDDLAAEVERITVWCAANGINVLMVTHIRQVSAARYLDLKLKTLQNWSSMDDPLSTRKHRGITYVSIEALALYIKENF